MIAEKALKLWAAACDRTDIRWYLFKETLLCADGHHVLPKELPCAQIAVLAKDLPDLVEYVFPALPKKWTLSKTNFIDGKRQLIFRIKSTVVLEINVLYGVECEDQMMELTEKVKKATKKVKRQLKRRKSIYNVFKKLFGRLYTKTFGRLTKRSIRKITQKAFDRMIALADTSNENADFYCDCLTNKKPVLFDKPLFQDVLMLGCISLKAHKTLLAAAKGEEVEDDTVDELADENSEDLIDELEKDTVTENTEETIGEETSDEEASDEEASDEEASDEEVSDERIINQESLELYPVFSGYRDYLSAVYGDYENGLTDEIGCGLTVEEKEELRQHQARCFQALTFLQELSKEFGLRYYLIAGSVLGTVRHGGFIPWDDDIDIGIRIEEIEEFERVVKEYLPNRLPNGFALEQSGANNPYPRMFSKICYEGRCCIDLWPLVPTYRNGFKAKQIWHFGKIITKVHYEKIGHPVNKFRKIVKPAAMLLSDKMVMAMARHNERKYANKQTPAYINLYSIYRRHKETFKREWLDEEATALFNGLEVPVVGHTKLYLTHLYGNYMAKPAPWKRASRHVARFSQQTPTHK